MDSRNYGKYIILLGLTGVLIPLRGDSNLRNDAPPDSLYLTSCYIEDNQFIGSLQNKTKAHIIINGEVHFYGYDKAHQLIHSRKILVEQEIKPFQKTALGKAEGSENAVHCRTVPDYEAVDIVSFKNGKSYAFTGEDF